MVSIFKTKGLSVAMIPSYYKHNPHLRSGSILSGGTAYEPSGVRLLNLF